MEEESISIKKVLQKLGAEKITSLLVEGGATVNDSFLKTRYINQLIMYIAPIIIGGNAAPGTFGGDGFIKLSDALNLQIKEIKRIGEQIKIIALKEENDVYRNR